MEFIQLQSNLFNLELKDNDPMALASKIKAFMHDIDVASGKVNIAFMAYIKDLYPKYSEYLELLQASGNLKSHI